MPSTMSDGLLSIILHVAPVGSLTRGSQSQFHYRYWLVVGDEAAIAHALDVLIEKYREEEIEIDNRFATRRSIRCCGSRGQIIGDVAAGEIGEVHPRVRSRGGSGCTTEHLLQAIEGHDHFGPLAHHLHCR